MPLRTWSWLWFFTLYWTICAFDIRYEFEIQNNRFEVQLAWSSDLILHQPVQNATKNDQKFLRPSIPFIATQCQLYQPTQSKLMNLLRKKIHSLLVNVALTSNGMTCKLAAAMTRLKMVQLTRQQKRHFWRMPSGQLSHIPISNYVLTGLAWWFKW